MLRVGLIGLGTIHRAHLEGYRRLGERVVVRAVCDPSETALASYSGLHSDQGSRASAPRRFTDFHELLASGLVDLVDVMVPHGLHEKVAAEALRHGLHVLVEKPLAPSSEAAERLRELADEAGTFLGVAENTRFVDAYQVVEGLLGNGSIGEVTRVRTLICGSEVGRLRQGAHWKARREGSGGGAILDAGVHSFYLLSWLFTGVGELAAAAQRLVPESEVEDNAVVVGTLCGGAPFVTECTFTAEIPWNERLEVYGSKGSVIVDQLAEPVVRLFAGSVDFRGRAIGGVRYDPKGWKQASIAAGVEDFVSAVEDRRPPKVSLEHAIDSIVTAEAAYHALVSARPVRPSSTARGVAPSAQGSKWRPPTDQQGPSRAPLPPEDDSSYQAEEMTY